MIKDVALTDDVLEYAALDTIIPWRIFHKQLQRGRAMGYEKHYSIVAGLS